MTVVISDYRSPLPGQTSLEKKPLDSSQAYVVVLRREDDTEVDVFCTYSDIREDDHHKKSNIYRLARIFSVGAEDLLERYLRWVEMEIALKSEEELKIEVQQMKPWSAQLTIMRRLGSEKRKQDFRVSMIRNEDELYADGPLVSGYEGKSSTTYIF